jgi:hypothetical protein
VEKEIITFMLMLEPFKLTEEDVKKDEKLKVSHYAEISPLHAKVSDARKKVLRQRASVEERKVAMETARRVERPTSSYGRNKERPATEEGDKKLPARPVTREGRATTEPAPYPGPVVRPTSSYGRNKERPATEEGDKKLPARPVTREGRD